MKLHTGKLPSDLGYFQKCVERFWRQVSKPAAGDGCWFWLGAKSGPNKSGHYYGQFTVAVNQKQVSCRAHRVAWMLLNGAIPGGQCILHTCDNTLCVNPAHLTPGTQYENVVDCVEKNRHTIGERNRHAKLTAAQVIRIRQSDRSNADLARQFDVCHSTIYNIRAGKRWKHLPLSSGIRSNDG